MTVNVEGVMKLDDIRADKRVENDVFLIGLMHVGVKPAIISVMHLNRHCTLRSSITALLYLCKATLGNQSKDRIVFLIQIFRIQDICNHCGIVPFRGTKSSFLCCFLRLDLRVSAVFCLHPMVVTHACLAPEEVFHAYWLSTRCPRRAE